MIGDLRVKLPQLLATESKISNIFALQERLEALQARELESIPSNLDELILIQKNNPDTAEKQVSYKQKLQEVTDKYQPKNLRIGVTVVVSVLVSWGTALIMIDNHKTQTNLLTKKIEKLETRLQQIESQAEPNSP